MFGILLLLTCPLCGDSAEIRPAIGQTSAPPRLLSPGPNYAIEPTSLTEIRRVHDLLQHWEASSDQQSDRSISARQSLRLTVTKELNGHAALTVEQLSGRIRAGQLEDQFTWSIAEDAEDLVCLEARPKDETEHLFYGSIRAWLDSKTGQLVKLQATDRLDQVRANWLADPRAPDPELVRVAYVPSADRLDDGIPPTPAIFNNQGLSAVLSIMTSASPTKPAEDPKEESSPVPTDLSPVTPELAKILTKWEAASRDTKRTKIRFTRTEYNVAFEVEKCADGELFYEAPDKIRMDIRPSKKLAESLRRGKDGRSFRVEADRSNSWVLTANEFIWIDDPEKTFNRVVIPEKSGALRLTSWGPEVPRYFLFKFLVDIHAEQLRKEWKWELLKTGTERAIITARPKTDALLLNCSRCMIIINTKTWQTVAVKFYDPNGHFETVFKVDERQMNPTLPEDCFTPDLDDRGYRDVSVRAK